MKKMFLALVTIALMVTICPTVEAQTTKSLLSVYSITSDTVVNTATVTLSASNRGGGHATTVWVAVTKISGTVGGTLTLQGSFDGTTYKAVNTPDTQTALATVTATDASNTYHWRLAGNPFPYYRVSWTGTGTMSASFTAKVLTQ